METIKDILAIVITIIWINVMRTFILTAALTFLFIICAIVWGTGVVLVDQVRTGGE